VVIDPEETKKSLFGGLKESKTPQVHKSKTPEVANTRTPPLPKWKTLEKITVLLTNQQRDAIEDLARTIMRYRPQESTFKEDRERITANTVVRVLIDILIETVPSLKMQELRNEDELKSWLRQLLTKN
jgi:hypothetical protein